MKRLLILSMVALTACSSVPPTQVHQPMSARPAPRIDMAAGNGSIYQAGGSRPLFEDRRARFIGDTLTIKLDQKTEATKSADSKAAKENTQTASVRAFAGLPIAGLNTLDLEGRSKTDFKGNGSASNDVEFKGSVTVTVIDVYPNGNLLVSGEKMLAIGQEQEYVRISGVVNPNFIDGSNTVNSSTIADARIEYKSSGQIADSQAMGWLARFFLTVLPF